MVQICCCCCCCCVAEVSIWAVAEPFGPFSFSRHVSDQRGGTDALYLCNFSLIRYRFISNPAGKWCYKTIYPIDHKKHQANLSSVEVHHLAERMKRNVGLKSQMVCRPRPGENKCCFLFVIFFAEAREELVIHILFPKNDKTSLAGLSQHPSKSLSQLKSFVGRTLVNSIIICS